MNILMKLLALGGASLMLSSIAYAANSDGKRKFSDIPFSEILYSDMSASLEEEGCNGCLLYTSPSPRDATLSRMPSSA